MANTIWDVNQTNMVEPSQTLFDDGYALDAVPTSANINWLFHYITRNVISTGTMTGFVGGTIPDGWLWCNGSTISKSDINPVSYYGDQYEDLFTYLWTDCASSIVTPGGKGASAAADWADNKVISVPQMENYTFAGRSTGAPGSSPFAVASGTRLGDLTHTLTTDEIPELNFTVNDPGHPHSFPSSFTVTATGPLTPRLWDVETPGTTNTNSATTGITIDSLGGGEAHSIIQPSFAGAWMIKW